MTGVLVILALDSGEASLAVAGGKGANLARLARAGFAVPRGFILTTQGYREYVAANHLQERILTIVGAVRPGDAQALAATSATLRALFAAGTMPPELAGALREAYARLGRPPVAVRSSATAEDLPDLSFAGQQETYLNVVGEDAVPQAVVQCWSSLWTARALDYRARNGIAQEGLTLAVVVQEMVASEAAGVLFSANPLTGKRTEAVINATLGLGEALVAGQVEPDQYIIDAARGRIVNKRLGAKALPLRCPPPTVGEGGVRQVPGGSTAAVAEAAARQALSDDAIADLTHLGRRVAALFGSPQDIEWAWANGKFFLLQSRPITSLYPLPEGLPFEPLQVLASFGAIQGMLDPMTPLGQDMVRAVGAAVFGQVSREPGQFFAVAGERLFLNVTGLLRNRALRALCRRLPLALLEPGLVQSLEALWDDPRLGRRAPTLTVRQNRRRERVPRPLPMRGLFSPLLGRWSLLWGAVRLLVPSLGRVVFNLLWPEAGHRRIQRRIEETVARAEVRMAGTETPGQQVAAFQDVLRAGLHGIAAHFPPGLLVGLAPLYLLKRLRARLRNGRPDVLEITRGLRDNVTTEMDLALWATARVLKADPASASRFAQVDAATLAADYLARRLPGAAQAAIAEFLKRYGMRGLAEIDLGRRRWREEPTMIMQVLQSYLRIEDAKQAPDVVFARGAASAEAAVNSLAQALRRTRGGWLKARLVRWAARRVRALAGVRESPKFLVIRLFGLARERLLDSGRRFVAAGVLAEPDDVFFLHLPELQMLAAGDRRDWRGLVAERRQAYAREKRRRLVPRLLLSDGQAFYAGTVAPARSAAGLLVGTPVSPGVAEGMVHVVLDPSGVQVAPGEILVCPGTDPSWTPLFLTARGLVTEVGGLLTHGSVVAREYGIPAVVGVHQATSRLRTGQRVRLDGSSGQITILDDVPETKDEGE